MDTILNTIATIILVLITAYYAWQTRRTVEEMRKSREVTHRTVEEMIAARELALMPTLTSHLAVDRERASQASNYMGAGTLDVAADYTTLVLTNVGNAPALDVAIGIVGDPHDRGRLRVFHKEERVGILGVGAEWRCPVEFGKDHYLDPMIGFGPHTPLDQAIVVRASCANAYGRRFLTLATFDLGNDGTGITWIQRNTTATLVVGNADSSRSEDKP